MNPKDYRIVVDPVYSYRRIDPLPEDSELAQSYQSQYYDLIRKGGRAPDIRRLMAWRMGQKRNRSGLGYKRRFWQTLNMV